MRNAVIERKTAETDISLKLFIRSSYSYNNIIAKKSLFVNKNLPSQIKLILIFIKKERNTKNKYRHFVKYRV